MIPSASDPSDGPQIGYRDLLRAFLRVGLMGFGGVAVSAHRVLVEERRWLTDADYAALLAMGQALPGANTVNVAVMLGDRARGWRGALVAVTGLMAVPLVVLGLALVLYERAVAVPEVRGALAGVAAAAAGLVAGTAIKMLRSLGTARNALLFAVLALAPLLGAPLLATLMLVGAASVAVAAREGEE